MIRKFQSFWNDNWPRWQDRYGLPSWGELAVAALFIAIVSGLLEALHYRPGNTAFEDVVRIQEEIPFGFVMRGLHYWSGEIFLVSVLIHALEQLWKNGFVHYREKRWLQISLLLPLAVLVNFTGFVLTGSLDGQFAATIMQHLAQSIPLIGNYLSGILIYPGLPEDLLYLPWLHHIGTFTLLLYFLTYRHLYRVFAQRGPLGWTFLLCLLPTLLVSVSPGTAPHAVADPVRGPWFFWGVQELLHWLPAVAAGVILPLSAFALYAVLPLFKTAGLRRAAVWSLWIMLLIYVVLTFVAGYLRGPGWEWLL